MFKIPFNEIGVIKMIHEYFEVRKVKIISEIKLKIDKDNKSGMINVQMSVADILVLVSMAAKQKRH